MEYGHRNPLVRLYFWSRLDKALTMSNVSGRSVVLDVGTGHGFLLPSLTHAASKVYACDTDRRQIAKAHEFVHVEVVPSQRGKVLLICASACALPLLSGSVDIVFILDCLEHMPEPHNEQALMEIKRVLRVGGSLICSLPNEKGLSLLLRTLFGKLTGIPRPNFPLKALIAATIHTSAIGEHRGHVGYDYVRDFRLIRRMFRNVALTFCPWPLLDNVNPTVVVRAEK